jgi:hypothetical protein
MRLLDLNDHILTTIGSHVFAGDIMSWRQTSRMLAATAEVFRYRRVFLRTTASIKRACTFLSAHPKYARYVQELRVQEAWDLEPAQDSDNGENDPNDDDIDGFYKAKRRRVAPVLALVEAAANLRVIQLDSAEDILSDFGTAWPAALLRHTSPSLFSAYPISVSSH